MRPRTSARSSAQLTNVAFDFFSAGMETTATTLGWAALYLAADQDAQVKLLRRLSVQSDLRDLLKLV